MRRLGVVLVLAGSLALGGCAQKLDTGKIESEVKKELASKTGSQIASVDCPSGVEAKQGGAASAAPPGPPPASRCRSR